MQIVELICKVATPFIAMLLPAYVIKLIEDKNGIEEIILCIIGAFLVYTIVTIGQACMEQSMPIYYTDFKISVLIPEFVKKCISIDYDKFESAEVRKKVSNSYRVIMGRPRAMEDMPSIVLDAMKNLLGILIYMLIVAVINPWIIVLFLGTSIIQFIIYHHVNNYNTKTWHIRSPYNVTMEYLNTMVYNLRGIKDVHLFNLVDWLGGKYRNSTDFCEKIEKKSRVAYISNDAFGIVMQLVRDIVCYIYLFDMFKNGMTASTFVVMVGAISGFSAWFSGLANAILALVNCSTSTKMFREFLDIENEKVKDNMPDTDGGYEIEFIDVSFSYPESDKIILDKINFKINSNENIALVGINGAGKSTLIKLISGFYKPTSGKIYINGVDITTIQVQKYQSTISAIFQDSFIPHIKIIENIMCAELTEHINSSTKDKVLEALKDAGLIDKIKCLKDKELTYIGREMDENGVDLSGGERQKLAVARAIYRDSNLLLLDEPTAALDAIAESKLYESFASMAKNKTSIFISHRLASTKFCDKILLLNNGVINEAGTHEELLLKKGKYYEMYEMQRKNYIREKEISKIENETYSISEEEVEIR